MTKLIRNYSDDIMFASVTDFIVNITRQPFYVVSFIYIYFIVDISSTTFHLFNQTTGPNAPPTCCTGKCFCISWFLTLYGSVVFICQLSVG